MNAKKYIIGSLVVFIVMYALEFGLHGMILAGAYNSIQHILRPEADMMTYMPAMVIGFLLYAFGFCYLFTRGYEGKGIAESLRFGFYIGFFFGVSSAMIEYAVYPISGWIMLAYFIGYPIMNMIMGAVFAAIYKPAK